MFTPNTFRRLSLTAAEAFDAWRVVPRLMLVAYGFMVWAVVSWYMSIPSANQTQCQADVLSTLLSNSVPVDQARNIACSITETIGGPTSEQTMFVSIVTGLSSVVMGLYLNTGKTSKWQGGVLNTLEPANTLASDYQYRRTRRRRRGESELEEGMGDVHYGDDTPLDEELPLEQPLPNDEEEELPLSPDPRDQG